MSEPPDQIRHGQASNRASPDRNADPPGLDHLIREIPALWRGRQRSGQPARPGSHAVDTGFDGLNRLLPNGGWPLRAMIEINVAAWGNGELQLLLPLMARLTRGHSRVAMVAPPLQPYAPALVQGGVDLSWLVVVDCAGSRQTGAGRSTRISGGRRKNYCVIPTAGWYCYGRSGPIQPGSGGCNWRRMPVMAWV